MRVSYLRLLFAAFALASLVHPLLLHPTVVHGDAPCTTRSDNLTRNGSITDGGYDTLHGIVANSWNPFLIGGEWPVYELADNESANGDIAGSSSQYIHGDGIQFDAGIYQVITGVKPGASYEFSVGWAQMLRDVGGGNNQKIDDVIARRVGADPSGGTDPTSPNVIWGPEMWSGGRGLNNDDMRLTFKATAETVTVFVRVYNRGTAPSDKVFLDVMCLVPRTDIPVEEIQPTPTPTLLPTDTPVAIAASIQPTRPRPTRPPTDTPAPPTEQPTEVAVIQVTSTPRPRATRTPEPRPFIPKPGNDGGSEPGTSGSSAAPSAPNGGSALSVAVILGSIGIIAISVLGILAIGAFAIWRIFVRQVDEVLDPDFPLDDHVPYDRE